MIVYGVCQCLTSGQLISVSQDGTIRRWQPTQPSSSSSGISDHQCQSLGYRYDPNGVCDVIHEAHNGKSSIFMNYWYAYEFYVNSCDIIVCFVVVIVCCCSMIGDMRFVTGGWDNSIKIWDLVTLKCQQTMNGHTGTGIYLCDTLINLYW